MTHLDKHIFKMYDIRGIVDESLTEAVVTLIGQALGTLAQRQGQQTIVTAKDGRLSGPKLMQALQQGILQSGCDVIDIGMVPTPLLYFATNTLSAQSGAMLTGSHNPPNYNGIKIVIAGKTLSGEDIQGLYQMIVSNDLNEGQGQLQSHNSIVSEYLSRVTSDIKLQKPLKIVVDCGNGVAGGVAPNLYKALGAEVIELFCEVDGHFPNHHPDPSEAENLTDLIAALKTHDADIGLAFDGDGDRLGVVTPEGKVIWPDRQLMLFAKDVLTRNPGAEIIYDVKCTRYLPKVIEENGGKATMSRTGHSLVKAKLRETGAALAGEMSGHLFFKERWYGFDDGLYSGARLLEILSKTHESADQVFNALPEGTNTPEIKIDIAEDQKSTFMQMLIEHAHFDNANVSTLDGLRVDFEDGFGLVRPSNTTPVLVCRFEGDNLQALERIRTQFEVLIAKTLAFLESH